MFNIQPSLKSISGKYSNLGLFPPQEPGTLISRQSARNVLQCLSELTVDVVLTLLMCFAAQLDDMIHRGNQDFFISFLVYLLKFKLKTDIYTKAHFIHKPYDVCVWCWLRTVLYRLSRRSSWQSRGIREGISAPSFSHFLMEWSHTGTWLEQESPRCLIAVKAMSFRTQH